MNPPTRKELTNAKAGVVWDLIGKLDLYDRYITGTTHPILMRYLKFERDFLDHVILNLKTESMVLIEIGCGTGRLLLQYINPFIKPLAADREITDAKRLMLASKIKHAVGIDFSPQMIRRLKENFRRYHIGADYQISTVQRDATQLNSFLPQILRKHKLERYRKVFCIMLCTLGNMRSKTRMTLLREIRKAMNYKDVLVVSVWNRALFEKGVREIYPKFTSLIGDFGENNINYQEAAIETETHYYIHWFSKNEVKKLLEETGFKVIEVAPKIDDFFILFKATAAQSGSIDRSGRSFEH